MSRQPRVGDSVQLIRSGHAPGSCEQATVIAVYGKQPRTVLRVRWAEGRESFVPVVAVQALRSPGEATDFER
jgi:hypothetical protein